MTLDPYRSDAHEPGDEPDPYGWLTEDDKKTIAALWRYTATPQGCFIGDRDLMSTHGSRLVELGLARMRSTSLAAQLAQGGTGPASFDAELTDEGLRVYEALHAVEVLSR